MSKAGKFLTFLLFEFIGIYIIARKSSTPASRNFQGSWWIRKEKERKFSALLTKQFMIWN